MHYSQEATITELSTFPVDMSAYKGLHSSKHSFLGTTPEEFLHLIEEGGSGVFYFGDTDCPNCQEAAKLMNEAAEEADIPIYYIYVYDPLHPLSEHIEEVNALLHDLYPEYNGKRELMLPFFFTVRNGKPDRSYTGLISGYQGTPEDRKKMKDIYSEIIKGYHR